VIAPAKLPRPSRTVAADTGDPTTILNDIAAAYGKATARYVALTMEHPYWLKRD
jgi:hypothetical protein